MGNLHYGSLVLLVTGSVAQEINFGSQNIATTEIVQLVNNPKRNLAFY